MRLHWPRPATERPRAVSPDDARTIRWDFDDPTPPTVHEDEATGSQVDWDEEGRPVFTVFFASGASKRYVDDATAWRAVDVFGVTKPGVRRLT